jgi:hypothetical protein
MGFLDAIRDMAAGRPVFKVPNQQNGQQPPQPQQQQPQPPASTPRAQEGPKERPVAVIERVENRPNGPNLEVSITIQNNSQQNIMLDKVLFMGRTHELDTNLSPGQEREFVNVYSGPKLNNRGYNTAELHYRDQTGNYFSALNTVEFRQEPDGTYVIERFRLQLPIKDSSI